MLEPLETREVGALSVELRYDEAQGNDPRDWDNVSVMVGTDRRASWGDYQAGDPDNYFGVYGYGSATNWLIAEYDAIRETIQELYLPRHGAVGYVFATPASIAMTGVEPEHIDEAIEQDVKTYAAWIEGEVYGYVVLDQRGEHIDSCWGYVGEPDYALSEGIAVAEDLRPVGQAFVEAGVGL